MKPTYASQAQSMARGEWPTSILAHDARRTKRPFSGSNFVHSGIQSMSSFAASSWQNQLFRRICRDLKLGEREEIRILKLQADVVRELRKRLVSDRFD